MKNYFLSLLFLSGLVYLNSCFPCISDGDSYYHFSNIKSYLVVENPQNQYHLNDTLWASLKVPSFFYEGNAKGRPCTINTDSLNLVCDNLYLYTTNDSLEFSFSKNYELLYLKKGSFINDYWYLSLEPENDYYIITFGILLDNTNIHSFGTNRTSIRLFNADYTERFCGYESKCQNDTKGFNLPINFANNEDLKFSFTVVP